MRAWLLIGLVCMGCGGRWPPFGRTAMDRIGSAERARAWRVDPSSRQRVGDPIELDAAALADARSLHTSRSTYGGQRVKCIFQPAIELELDGPAGPGQVQLCFGCDDMMVIVDGGDPEWARFVPGHDALHALYCGIVSCRAAPSSGSS